MPAPATPPPVLETRHLSVHYGQRPALDDVSISVHAGEIVGVLGPNGAGKSTLLKVLAGIIPASHGSSLFHGQPIHGANPCITYVPQRAGAEWTFPISVVEAVLLGLTRSTPRWRGFSDPERSRAMEALDHVQMREFADVQIGALSGGQQQRVFLARALLACGEVLLLDEPFTGVDVPTQELFTSLFTALTAQGTTIIYATHDLEQARRTSNRILLLNRGVVAFGNPADVFGGDGVRKAFGGTVLVLPAAEQAPAGTGAR